MLYAIRDLNPEPADKWSRRHLSVVGSGNRGLPVDRIPAGWPIPEPPAPRESPEATFPRLVAVGA